MKSIIYIFIISIFLGCSTNEKRKTPKEDETVVTENKRQRNDLEGTWGLTNYLDTILHEKQIAKYRIQPPSWFAILLEINKDSLISYGSIVATKQKIDFESDTLAVFESFGGKYFLQKKQNELWLKQISNNKRIDSTTYIFRKRTDLKEWVENTDGFHKISNGVTAYFNKHLISGTYINPNNNDTIQFLENGDLIHYEGFDKYEVRNYFGTLHPHNNLDVITLTNSSTQSFEQLNWKISKDKLVLTEFVPEVVIRFGKKTPTDNYVLGKDKTELILKKK